MYLELVITMPNNTFVAKYMNNKSMLLYPGYLLPRSVKDLIFTL